MHKKHIFSALKFAVLLAIIIISLVLLIAYMSTGFGMQTLKEIVLSYGNNAWIAGFLLTIVIVSLGLTTLIPMVLASLLFSVASASLMICFGFCIGSVIAFFIARWLGKEYVEEKLVSKNRFLKSFDQKLHKHGFYTMLLSRLIFLIPSEFVNFAAGVSEVKFQDYFIATVIGTTPGTILAIYIIKKLNSIYSLQFFAASFIFLLLALVPLLSKKMRKAVF